MRHLVLAIGSLLALTSPSHAQIASMSMDGNVMPDRSTIAIASVDVPDDGIVAVRIVVDGKVKRIPVAQVAVKKGRTTSLRLPLPAPAGDGQIYVVTLHADQNHDGKWDTGDTVVIENDVYAATATSPARVE